jgi:serine/threonine-protein kinase RsbW
MPTSNEHWTWQCDQVIPSDAVVGRQLLDDVLRQLESQHWGHHDIFGVHLALDEALINAIYHGNAHDEKKRVRFACRVSPERIHVEITDEGPGFDPDALPDPTTPCRIGRPGGRGVLLMRAFMSRVEFCDHGSRVVLEKVRDAVG